MTRKTTINPIEILASLSWNESEDLEFKSAKGGIPRDLWETYSAMANTQGGVILLGVRDDGVVSGIADTNKSKKAFWDGINNRQVVSINLLSSTDVQVIDHPHGKFMAIRIPRADRRDRPVYTGQNLLTGTYRRNHEGDYHCTEREVRRMLADSSEESADDCLLENFTLKDLDLPSLQQYRNRLASKNPSHPWLEEDDTILLQKLGGWRSNRKEGIEGLTLAGLIMFGRDETIREAVPQFQVDFRERLSLDPSIRWSDRLTQDGTWTGNLYQFYHRVIQKLSSDLKLPFELEKDLSRKGETPVHVAIREALVNALIHADYKGQGGIVIEKYPDRLEFSNPGSLLVSFDQILEGGVSECRNKSLQQMFTMIGAAERAGSGIDKIRVGWKSQHWRFPTVKERVRPDRVTWILPMVSLIPDESLERLKNIFSDGFSRFKELEVQALVTADLEGYVDNARMRELTGIHTADVTKLLQGLVAQKALVQNGQGRWTRYSITVHKGSDIVHKGSDIVHKGSDIVHKGSDIVHKDVTSEDQWKFLMEIAQPARENKRLPPKQMEIIILKICKEHWLTRRQISDLVNRNSDGIRSRFLTPMLDRKLLELRYPDKPQRTDQAYRTTK